MKAFLMLGIPVGTPRANVHLNVQRQLFARSERVKGIDFHPTEPWV
jgi:coatomer subunit beta'